MIIDSHVHYSPSEDFLKRLFTECDRLKIDKVCLIGKRDELVSALSFAPDRVIPLERIRLGYDSEQIVEEAQNSGMMGLKIINPAYNYDDERAFPIYEKAAELDMPILFHLGIVARKDDAPDIRDHHSNRMRPIYLDYIARNFPKLKIIGAHLGNPWYEEASMTGRWNSNVWYDLSGSTLKKKSTAFIRSLLWWDKPNHPYQAHGGKHPYEKVVFGTDVAVEWMEDVMNDYKRLMDELDVPEEYRRKIFGHTAAEIFGISGA